MEKDRVYTLSQVNQHRSKKDIWLIINGRVVDVTKFLEEHPGGEDVLMKYAGEDATEGFDAVGHSKGAFNLLLKYQVGCLQGYSIDDRSNEQLPKETEMEAYVVKDDDTNTKYSHPLEYLVPVLAAGLYFGYRCMTGGVHFGS